MSDVFYLRPIDPAIRPADVYSMGKHAGGCFGMHRVDWIRSFLSSDGARMLCWYRAPDAESARIALRQLGSDMTKVWAGSVRALAEDATVRDDSVARVAAEYAPGAREETTSIARQLAEQGLHPEVVFESTDGARAVLILRDRDDERVRGTLESATPAPTATWGCAAITPTA
jgi:hypothetical protein